MQSRLEALDKAAQTNHKESLNSMQRISAMLSGFRLFCARSRVFCKVLSEAFAESRSVETFRQILRRSPGYLIDALYGVFEMHIDVPQITNGASTGQCRKGRIFGDITRDAELRAQRFGIQESRKCRIRGSFLATLRSRGPFS
jgi:hypothetical protein